MGQESKLRTAKVHIRLGADVDDFGPFHRLRARARLAGDHQPMLCLPAPERIRIANHVRENHGLPNWAPIIREPARPVGKGPADYARQRRERELVGSIVASMRGEG